VCGLGAGRPLCQPQQMQVGMGNALCTSRMPARLAWMGRSGMVASSRGGITLWAGTAAPSNKQPCPAAP
jgi:hypothetical protein